MIETYLKLLRLYLKEKLDYTKLSKPITQMDFDEIDNTIFYENLSNFELEELKNQMKLTDYLENTSLSEYLSAYFAYKYIRDEDLTKMNLKIFD